MKKTLLLALFLVSLSGLLLHYRIHNFMVHDKLDPSVVRFDGTKFLAFIFPLLDIIGVTALFTSRKTAVYGYLFNGLLVIYGTVLMAHFSIAGFIAKPVPPATMLLTSTLPDIGIAWVDFFIGKALYELHMKGDQP